MKGSKPKKMPFNNFKGNNQKLLKDKVIPIKPASKKPTPKNKAK